MILAHNHRQGEGCKWANVLNEFRLGIVSDENFKLIEERVTDDPMLDFDSMHISYTNPEVQATNDRMLNLLKTDLVSIPAFKRFPKGRKPKIQDDGRIENRKIMNVLRVKIGAITWHTKLGLQIEGFFDLEQVDRQRRKLDRHCLKKS